MPKVYHGTGTLSVNFSAAMTRTLEFFDRNLKAP
jgi:hypothetical protein